MQKIAIKPPSQTAGELEPLLTIAQVAAILGVTRPTVYELIYKHGLPVVRLQKNVRVIPTSLTQWLATREQLEVR
ncbi:hypothetical protein KDW_17670 [Dictyobacter vulcani]|uniref:Helix-turn-helix domain-containing protein n=1 Tax=Dictyobacter vulcani TaxID=2607529 RepID=A0A5J4KIK7_9CHLR|nr:hypothetical protein KDW_17670 [Dictyobacter vulcani]